MTPSTITLPNGLRVVALRTEGVPLVTIGVAYHVGAANESPDRTGYAHLFEHLMFDNLSRADGKSFDELVTDAGGTSNAYTTYDWTYYHTTLPSSAWELAIELEAERMRSFAITPTALETQRRVVIEEIAENVFNQPYGTAQSFLAQAAFAPGTCYSWDIYGSIEHLRAMTLDDAFEWYERYYRPDNAVLTVVGRVESTTAIVERIAELFGRIEPSSTRTQDICTVAPNHALHTERDTTLPSDMLICAYHLPGMNDRTTLRTARVLTALLGSGRSSPIARSFIYEHMLAYNATVSLDARQYGSLLVFSAIARDKRITVETLLAHWEMLLPQLRDLPQPDEHLLRARNKIRRHYAQSYQTTEGLADELAVATLLFNDPEHPWKELTHLTSVEFDEVIELANTLCMQEPAIVQYSTVES